MAAAATRPSAIFFMVILLLVPRKKTRQGQHRSGICELLAAGSTQKLSKKFGGAMELAAIRSSRVRERFVHSAAMRKSLGASSCSAFLPLSQDWKRSR